MKNDKVPTMVRLNSTIREICDTMAENYNTSVSAVVSNLVEKSLKDLNNTNSSYPIMNFNSCSFNFYNSNNDETKNKEVIEVIKKY